MNKRKTKWGSKLKKKNKKTGDDGDVGADDVSIQEVTMTMRCCVKQMKAAKEKKGAGGKKKKKPKQDEIKGWACV